MMRLRISLPVVAALLMAGGWLAGQDTKKGDDKEPIIVRRSNLPKHYKKLGLSDEQTRQVVKIQVHYSAKIEALRQQIAELRQAEEADLDKVLTDTQRARLKELKLGEPKVKPEDSKKESK
jgi:hypothetical protein